MKAELSITTETFLEASGTSKPTSAEGTGEALQGALHPTFSVPRANPVNTAKMARTCEVTYSLKGSI